MRINKFVALATGISRRSADEIINSGAVRINVRLAQTGEEVKPSDRVYVNNLQINLPAFRLVLMNKPVGYVCSKSGQGNKTVYELLPKRFSTIKTIGRLDKNSSGLLLLTNDGHLAEKLSHPSSGKIKTYQVVLDKNLSEVDIQSLLGGVRLSDGVSKFARLEKTGPKQLTVYMQEGRNRQIRRTFEAIGYQVTRLHRIGFGPYSIGKLKPGEYQEEKI